MNPKVLKHNRNVKPVAQPSEEKVEGKFPLITDEEGEPITQKEILRVIHVDRDLRRRRLHR